MKILVREFFFATEIVWQYFIGIDASFEKNLAKVKMSMFSDYPFPAVV